MIFWNRLKNLWAWSAYHPSDNLPENVGFTWKDKKKAQNILETPRKAQIIKRNTPIKDFLQENEK